jgi:hypothetical protein
VKKIINILFFIIYISVTLSLLFSDYLSEIVEIRKSIFVILNDNKTETITFSKEEWIKLSNKDEFEKNGNYYDTKSFSIKNNIVQVVAVKDKMELFLKLISKNSSNKKEQKQNLKTKINLYLTSSIIRIDLFKGDKKKNQVLYLSPFYNKLNLSIFRPPILL